MTADDVSTPVDEKPVPPRPPRDPDDDYGPDAARARREFLAEQTGVELDHAARYSFDERTLKGNTEAFVGVAQVPVGLAGPLVLRGEKARGHVYVPMATTEGTLVASYSRGMRVLAESGGVRTTVVHEAMQRAPVFLLPDARAARDLRLWVDEHLDQARAAGEATTSVGRLTTLDAYQVGPNLYLRVNWTTGDAAGQNMTGKATLAVCEWIREHHPDRPDFVLSGAIDTDKKHSHLNLLATRGRRVVAEAVIPDRVLRDRLGVDAETVQRYRQVATTGAILAGSAYNGAHAANGLAALFVACGQDVANVAESHAGITVTELRDGGLYWSTTLTSLVVGTFGGGTNLATQSEWLQVLGCRGTGTVDRFAEICAGTVLAGDVSLTGAILAGHWVSSHDRLGRNRG